jgi:hypothetical protein
MGGPHIPCATSLAAGKKLKGGSVELGSTLLDSSSSCSKMKLLKVTPQNSKQVVGRQVLFTSCGKKVMCTVLRASESGKTIYINHPDLKGNLEVVSRAVYCVEE